MHKECLSEQGWTVLMNLNNVLLKHEVILAGGTALALQLGHRISYDLDFFTNKNFRSEPVISKIRSLGSPFQIISEEEGTLTAEIEGIKVSLFHYHYVFLDKPVVYKKVRLAGILDIASMKIIAVNQRGTKRDFVDLFVILQDIPFYKIAEHMNRRFGKERINPVHIGKSMVYFSDADSDPEPAYLKNRSINWEKIKIFFRGHVKQFVLDIEKATKDY
jgi:predicted nucleotidyltransferase component of viral defense system